MFEWQWLWAFLMLPLPWIIRRLLPAAKQQQEAVWLPFFQQLQTYQTTQSSSVTHKVYHWRQLCSYIIWGSLVCALAQPQWLGEPIKIPSEGRDLMLAVDLSGSMDEVDMPLDNQRVNRLTMVKHVLADFIQQRQGDRLGLILFGEQAYVQSPLSYDASTIAQLLNEAEIGLAGNATAIGDALGLAIKRLQERPAQSRVLILLTDGQNTAGEIRPEQAANLAQQAGVKIYTIGIGADEMLKRSLFGTHKVNPSADLDENLLRSIAQQTGGRYFRARDQQQLESIYKQLDQLEPVEQEQQFFRPKNSLFHYPLCLALLLSYFLACSYLPWSVWRAQHASKAPKNQENETTRRQN